ncbi:MAG: hypothetical protein AAB290_04585 [Candidatus Eisenbacteria bacterium]
MTLRLSRLAQRVGHSGTLAADDRRQRLRAAGRDIVSLGAGQLDFGTPAPVAQAGVPVVPGAVFGDDRCLRISFATSLDELTAALGRLAQALA